MLDSINPCDGQTALSSVPVGQRVLIEKITGGKSMTRRLLGLGLRTGSIIEVRQQRGRGVVVVCQGNRIALGSNVADQIMTRAIDEEAQAAQ